MCVCVQFIWYFTTFYSVFDQINAALVSIKRLLSKAFKNPTKDKFLNGSVHVQMLYQYQI